MSSLKSPPGLHDSEDAAGLRVCSPVIRKQAHMATCTLTPPLQSVGSPGRRLLQTSTTAAPEPPPPPPATVSVNEQQALTTILASVNQLATGQAELATNIATLGTEIDVANEEAAVSALLCCILLERVTEIDARVLMPFWVTGKGRLASTT